MASRLRIGRHRADDPGDCTRVIGIDQNIVLNVQQRAALQLAGQSPAIPEILVQSPSEEHHGIAVSQLGSRAKPFVERSTNNPVMVDQTQGFVRDDLFELVFGRSGARHIAGAGFGGNVVRPMPAQGVIVDVKFSSGSLDRRARRQQTLDPHALGVITALASPGARPLLSGHLCPHKYTSKIRIQPLSE
jgi:hypothetical protein